MSIETDARQSALEMLRDTLSAEDGAGSDLSVFRLEEGGEWAEVQGYIDMGHLVSEVVSWAREQDTREPSDEAEEAAGEAIWGRGWKVPKEVIRAALLAAREVRNRG